MLALSCSFLMVGCDKVQSLTGGSVKCGDETAKQLVVETFSKKVTNLSSERVKELIGLENITLDMGKVRSALNDVKFNVNNIRTTNTDPNNKKVYCVTEFVVQLPEAMINDANTSREVYSEKNVAQAAVLSDLSFESNQLKKDIDYSVQPTDDGKMVYVEVENSDALAYFVRDVAIDSLIKSARQSAVEIAQQEEAQRVTEQAANEQEYQNVLLSEAQAKLDNSNKNLNLVWNATTKEVREHLLDEQKIWLKKRNLECKLESTEYDNPEIARINCETNLTTQRTNELRQKIYYLE